MRGIACLIAVTLVPLASLAEASIVGSWILHIDNRQDPELTPASICLTFRPDNTFEFRRRGDARRDVFVGRYALTGNQLRLEGEQPVTEYVEVGQDRLRLVAVGDAPDQEAGVILDRT